MKNAQEIWEQVLREAESALPENIADIWLKPCQPISITDGRLQLDVGNSFVEKKIRENYLATLNEVIQRTGLGNGIELTLESRSGKKGSDKPSDSKPPVIGANGLNQQYDFASFVVGKSNRLAHAASIAVAESPGEAYNPLFIWGGVGLGKTHLMHAIGNYARSQNPNIKIAYLSSEKFTNELITAIMKSRTEEFRSKYRHVDILLIDDIQFLAGKDSTQDEFFHTFNDLHTSKKQIVLSSDRPPKELGDIEERIVSRFEWGLVTDIQQPDYETRIAILKKKAEQRRIPVNDDVIAFLAENIPSNIRELEGALNRIIASSNFSMEPITIDNTRDWLKDVIGPGTHQRKSIQGIADLVSAELGFSPDDIYSKKRTAEIALARQIAMYLCRKYTESSLQQIASAFGKKDHTTVLHANKKIEVLVQKDARVKKMVDNIEKKL